MAMPTDPAQLEALLNGPAITPPPGIVAHPGSAGAPNLNGALTATIAVCFILSSILFFIRLWTRFRIIRKTDVSDYLVILCYGAFIGLTGLLGKFAKEGGGRHTWDIRLKDIGTTTYWFLMAAMSYDITMILIKSAILVQIRVIFNPTKAKTFIWWSTWLLTAAVWIFYITTALIQMFFCTPVRKTWDPLVPGHCLDSDSGQLNVIASSFNIAIDTCMLMIPLVSISRLHLGREHRIAIGAVFSVGVLACLSAALRLYFSYLLQFQPDAIYNAMRLGLCAYAETTSGLIVACMPLIPRFVQKTIRESLLYVRIISSVRSLANVWSKSGQNTPNYVTNGDRTSVTSQRQGSRINATSSENFTKKAGPMEFAAEEVELQRYKTGTNNILRTVDIHTSRE